MSLYDQRPDVSYQSLKEKRMADAWKGMPINLKRFIVSQGKLADDEKDREKRHAKINELAARDFYGIPAKFQDIIENQMYCILLVMRTALSE